MYSIFLGDYYFFYSFVFCKLAKKAFMLYHLPNGFVLKKKKSVIFQVAWLRVDTQTILTIASHVITKNHRIAVTHSGHRTWSLHIRDTREDDRGWYMCQVNTDPMSSNTGFLEIVGELIVITFRLINHKKVIRLTKLSSNIIMY